MIITIVVSLIVVFAVLFFRRSSEDDLYAYDDVWEDQTEQVSKLIETPKLAPEIPSTTDSEEPEQSLESVEDQPPEESATIYDSDHSPQTLQAYADHPGWLWNPSNEEWVPDPDYVDGEE